MNRFFSSLAAVGLMAGCNAGGISIERLAAGSECAEGGVKITTQGKPPELVCNGANGTDGTGNDPGNNGNNGNNGAVTLLNQTPLSLSDTRCPRGGIEITAGPDTGGDGGVANDGVLQPNEVTSSSVICTGDDHARVGSLIPPSGPEGTHTIKVNGGEGTALDGGAGGTIDIAIQSGTNGGHLKVWKTGQATATFSLPTVPDADLGPVPLSIETDTTIAYLISPTPLAAGVPYIDSTGLFISQGPNVPRKKVTGLWVASGVTLTLPSEGPVLSIPRSCRIAGTIQGSLGSGFVAPVLRLFCGEMVLTSSSKLIARGTVSSSTINVTLASLGVLMALGEIDATGVVTSGGEVTLSAGGELYLGGTLSSNGGPAAAGGHILLTAQMGLFQQATINSNGGASTGIRSPGGAGGFVELKVSTAGAPLLNHAPITAKGGPNTATGCSFCNGGAGGRIEVTTANGPLANDGDLNVIGGNAGTIAGEGGTVVVNLSQGTSQSGGVGSLLFSGSVDASGGAGGFIGGAGGSVTIAINNSAAVGSELILAGYSSIEANGAPGIPSGAGGSIVLRQQAGNNDGAVFSAAGAVLNTVNMQAHGGSSTPVVGVFTPGGPGGTIDLRTQQVLDQPAASWELLLNTGNLDVKGGSGSSGGRGGTLTLLGRVSTTSSGALDVSGGASSLVSAGAGGSASLRCINGPMTVSSSIDASGGAMAAGTGQGLAGNGGLVVMMAKPTITSATLNARGGSADATIGSGGNGGTVWLTSMGGTTTQNTAPAPLGISVAAGPAKTVGIPGIVLVDGFSVTHLWSN